MFPARAFAPRYFAPHHWPKTGVTPASYAVIRVGAVRSSAGGVGAVRSRIGAVSVVRSRGEVLAAVRSGSDD